MEAIQKRLRASVVVLAIIGKDWIKVTDSAGRRRLDNPDDLVRLELSSALSMNVRVIPVLLDNAGMPSAAELPNNLKALSLRNALTVRGAAFERDMEYLGHFVSRYLRGTPKVSQNPTRSNDGQITPAVRDALVKSFQKLRDAASGAFMICEIPSGEFVQFTTLDAPKGSLILDLPSQALTTKQRLAAQRVLEENYRPECIDLGDGNFSYEVTLPFEPFFLAYYTLSFFEKVYEVVPKDPFTITIDD